MTLLYQRGRLEVWRFRGLYFSHPKWQVYFHAYWPFIMINVGRFYFGLRHDL